MTQSEKDQKISEVSLKLKNYLWKEVVGTDERVAPTQEQVDVLHLALIDAITSLAMTSIVLGYNLPKLPNDLPVSKANETLN